MCVSAESKIFSERQSPRHSFPCESVPNIERHCAWAGAGEERSNLEGWILGSVTRVRIWRDQWVSRVWNLRPIGKRWPCCLKWVHQLIDQSRMEWNENTLNRFFWPVDVQERMNIKLPSTPREDFFAWHYERNGLFSVRIAHRLASRTRAEELGGAQSTSADLDATQDSYIRMESDAQWPSYATEQTSQKYCGT